LGRTLRSSAGTINGTTEVNYDDERESNPGSNDRHVSGVTCNGAVHDDEPSIRGIAWGQCPGDSVNGQYFECAQVRFAHPREPDAAQRVDHIRPALKTRKRRVGSAHPFLFLRLLHRSPPEGISHGSIGTGRILWRYIFSDVVAVRMRSLLTRYAENGRRTRHG
jgi:hypothetical protein